jgi:hypothetical protein
VDEVEEVPAACEPADGELELQAANPMAAARTRAEVERDFMATIFPCRNLGGRASLGPDSQE